MYRVLIVDDEKLVADELESLFLTQDEIELEVHKAYLADDALTILKNLKIDILLSDIKMPGMDGFDLADHVTKLWPDIRIIFLTAYSEFDLIYRSQQYKNVAFLLKVDGEDAILRKINQTVAKIEEDRKHLVLSNTRELRICARELSAYLRGSGKLPRELSENAPVAAVMIMYTRPSDEEELFGLLERTRSILGSKVYAGAARLDDSFDLMVLQGQEEDADFVQQVNQIFDFITETALDEYGEGTSLALNGTSLTMPLLSSKLEIMRRFLNAFEQKGVGRVLTAEDELTFERKSEIHEWYKRFSGVLSDITEALRTVHFDRARTLMKPVREAAENISYMKHGPLNILYGRIVSELMDSMLLQKMLTRAYRAEWLYRIFTPSEFGSWGKAFDALEDLMEMLEEEKNDTPAGCESRFLDFIYSYVDGHLNEELSLTVLSEKMNYNPSYISRTFRNLTGTNLMEYITAKRCERAYELLRDTKYSVKEIAEIVGFSSSQYFATAFRKRYGMSAQEVRRLAGETRNT